MLNTFAAFPFFYKGKGLSRNSCIRQGYEKVHYRTYALPYSLPSFFFTYVNDELPQDLFAFPIDVYEYDTHRIIESIEPLRIPWKAFKAKLVTYVCYDGTAIDSLDLPQNEALYLKWGDYISEAFYACSDRRILFLEVSHGSKLGDVPYHTGFVQRIGIEGSLCDPTPSFFDSFTQSERYGTTVNYQNVKHTYENTIERTPGFLVSFLSSLHLADKIKANKDGEFLEFSGPDITIDVTKEECDESIVKLSFVQKVFEVGGCPINESFTEIENNVAGEYEPTDYDTTNDYF